MKTRPTRGRRKPLVPESSTVPMGQVRGILQAFVENEAEVLERAEAWSKGEPLSTVQERFLALANRPEFPEFFAFLSRRADDLLAPCHWLAIGPSLIEAREARIPTAAELIRLVQLVRHQRPDLLDFVRTLIVWSPLRTLVASSQPPCLPEGEALPREAVHGG